jgi:hypothetical protein
MVFFTFPEDARWDAEGAAVEFTVVLGEYQGTVRVARRAFQRLLDQGTHAATLPGSIPPPAHAVRACGRTEAKTAAIDRGRQYRDHGARPARTRAEASCWR